MIRRLSWLTVSVTAASGSAYNRAVTRIAIAFLLACSGLSAQTAGTATGPGQAEFTRGMDYSEGRGVPQDYAEAAKNFRKAAELGNAEAQNRLGQMLAIGQGVTQDAA